MKPKNFPANKLIRQLKAKGLNPDDYPKEIEVARKVRTKKHRA